MKDFSNAVLGHWVITIDRYTYILLIHIIFKWSSYKAPVFSQYDNT